MEMYPHEIISYGSNTDLRFGICKNNGCFVANHWHNSMEIIYIINGEYTVSINGTKHNMKSDDFVLINPRDIHSTSNITSCRFFLLQISYEFLKKHIPNIDFIEFHHEITKNNSNEIRSMLIKLTELCKNKSNANMLEFHSITFHLLYTIFMNFKHEISPDELQKNEKYIQRLSEITYYVKQHYNENISLADIASTINLNREYFSRFFKKHMGITFLEYLNSIRLEHVYTDLINTNLSISEILERNGFTNYKQFMKLFKKRYGCTPTEKRKQIIN